MAFTTGALRAECGGPRGAARVAGRHDCLAISGRQPAGPIGVRGRDRVADTRPTMSRRSLLRQPNASTGAAAGGARTVDPAGVVVRRAAVSLRLLAGAAEVRALRRSGACADKRFLAIVSPLARRMGMTRPVRILTSDRTGRPSVIGWWRPVILLPPATAMGLTDRAARSRARARTGAYSPARLPDQHRADGGGNAAVLSPGGLARFETHAHRTRAVLR